MLPEVEFPLPQWDQTQRADAPIQVSGIKSPTNTSLLFGAKHLAETSALC